MSTIFPIDVFIQSGKGKGKLTLAMPIGEAASDIAGAIRGWVMADRNSEPLEEEICSN